MFGLDAPVNSTNGSKRILCPAASNSSVFVPIQVMFILFSVTPFSNVHSHHPVSLPVFIRFPQFPSAAMVTVPTDGRLFSSYLLADSNQAAGAQAVCSKLNKGFRILERFDAAGSLYFNAGTNIGSE